MKNDVERPASPCQHFSSVDVAFVLVSLFTYVLDLITDCLLAWQFFSLGHPACGIWTLVFVLVPTVSLQLVSIRWYIAEKQTLCCSWTLLAHIFMLGPVLRYVSVLQHGRDAERSNCPESYRKLYQAQSDISCLRFIEAFLESAPQLILQGYFILTVQPLTWVSGLSTSVSLVSLAWAVASYSNALRLVYREAYLTNWGGLVVQALWHIGTVASRVVAITVFASVYHAWTFLAVGSHWLAMSVWVFIQGPEFFSHRWENNLFSFALGVVYIFCYLNLKDGPTRYKMWPFYLLLLAENGLLVGLWYREHPAHDTLMIVVTALVFGGYLLGVLFLLLYYGWCHPSGRIPLCREQKSAGHNHADTEQQVHEGPYTRRAFDASLMSTVLNPVFSSGYDLSLDSSWSGLVHSRRNDSPTFTTSKYRSSSRQLDICQTPNGPSDMCTRVFNTAHCCPTAPVNGLCHQNNKTNEELSTPDSGHGAQCPHLNSTCIICSRKLSMFNRTKHGTSICSLVTSESTSNSPLGCATLADSTDLASFSVASSKMGLDNAGFSIGSLAAIPTCGQSCSVGHQNEQLHSCPPALSASLPALCCGSGLNMQGDQTFCYTLPRKQSSVYALTGVPKNGNRKSAFCKSLHNRRLTYQKNQQKIPPRVFDHTQSLQSIPHESEHTVCFSLQPKQGILNHRMRSSCESLSSCSSNIRPRPLSPLNAQALWEESMIRFHKSFQLEKSSHDTSRLSEPSESGLTEGMPNVNPCESNHISSVSSSDQPKTETENSSLSSPQTNVHLVNGSDQGDVMETGNGTVSSLTGIPSFLATGLNGQSLNNAHANHGLHVDQSSVHSSSDEFLSPDNFHITSPGSYRTESSGFQSSNVDDSCDFFNYSDDTIDQSKHTLSDLARRLTISLDLNASKNHSSGKVHIVNHDVHRLDLLPAGCRDTPWRVDYQSRIPTPILHGSLLSLYSASEQSLSVASEMNYTTGSTSQGTSIIHGPKSHSHSRPVFPGYNPPVCNSLDSVASSFQLSGFQEATSPLKIYNLRQSPRGRYTACSHMERESAKSKREIVYELENYTNSPYKSHNVDTKRIENPKVSKRSKTNKNFDYRKTSGQRGAKRYISENLSVPTGSCSVRDNSIHTPVSARYLKFSGNQGSRENADSSTDSGKDSDVSSRDSLKGGKSFSDLTENMDPRTDAYFVSGDTPLSRRTEFLSTTPDFSPIGPSNLPPLMIGKQLLAPGQSYFSTPKASIPGSVSTSVLTNLDSKDDSFFGVQVLHFSGNLLRQKRSVQKQQHASPAAGHHNGTRSVKSRYQHSAVKTVGGHSPSMNSSTGSLSSSVTRQRSPLQTLDMNSHSSGFGNATEEI